MWTLINDRPMESSELSVGDIQFISRNGIISYLNEVKDEKQKDMTILFYQNLLGISEMNEIMSLIKDKKITIEKEYGWFYGVREKNGDKIVFSKFYRNRNDVLNSLKRFLNDINKHKSKINI